MSPANFAKINKDSEATGSLTMSKVMSGRNRLVLYRTDHKAAV